MIQTCGCGPPFALPGKLAACRIPVVGEAEGFFRLPRTPGRATSLTREFRHIHDMCRCRYRQKDGAAVT